MTSNRSRRARGAAAAIRPGARRTSPPIRQTVLRPSARARRDPAVPGRRSRTAASTAPGTGR